MHNCWSFSHVRSERQGRKCHNYNGNFGRMKQWNHAVASSKYIKGNISNIFAQQKTKKKREKKMVPFRKWLNGRMVPVFTRYALAKGSRNIMKTMNDLDRSEPAQNEQWIAIYPFQTDIVGHFDRMTLANHRNLQMVWFHSHFNICNEQRKIQWSHMIVFRIWMLTIFFSFFLAQIQFKYRTSNVFSVHNTIWISNEQCC